MTLRRSRWNSYTEQNGKNGKITLSLRLSCVLIVEKHNKRKHLLGPIRGSRRDRLLGSHQQLHNTRNSSSYGAYPLWMLAITLALKFLLTAVLNRLTLSTMIFALALVLCLLSYAEMDGKDINYYRVKCFLAWNIFLETTRKTLRSISGDRVRNSDNSATYKT